MNQQKKPFLSIIIATLNSEKTIDACIVSILNQTFSDYEVLIMDGASQDGTFSKLTKYDDSRINIYVEKDSGVYDAMNKGIKTAKGEWIYFLGSDDRFHDCCVLEQMFQEICRSRVDIIYGDVYNERTSKIYGGEFVAADFLHKNICHQAIIYSQKVFKSVGDFDLKYKVLADWAHNFRWFFNKQIRKKYIQLIVARYADTGLSHRVTDECFQRNKELEYLLCARKVLKVEQKVKLFLIQLKKANRAMDLRLFFRTIFFVPVVFIVAPGNWTKKQAEVRYNQAS